MPVGSMASDQHFGLTPNQGLAVQLAKRQLSELVCDAVQLEGINMTLPEVQTLLDGITVGGHKRSDQAIAINQANAWQQLFTLVEQDQFDLSQHTALTLHRIAAKEEALEWGVFRNAGVLIAGTDYVPPKADTLNKHWQSMLAHLSELTDVYDQAIHLFLTLARCQFFFDVNKRMGRFMMNGHLLAHGYPVINVPAARQLEFNTLMLAFYESGEQTEMNRFLRSCLQEKVLDVFK